MIYSLKCNDGQSITRTDVVIVGQTRRPANTNTVPKHSFYLSFDTMNQAVKTSRPIFMHSVLYYRATCNIIRETWIIFIYITKRKRALHIKYCAYFKIIQQTVPDIRNCIIIQALQIIVFLTSRNYDKNYFYEFNSLQGLIKSAKHLKMW